MKYVLALVLLLFTSLASAQEWTVTYVTRGEPGSGGFYPAGSYLFILEPTYIPVYIAAPRTDGLLDWSFIGMYGQPALGYEQAPVPAEIEPIHFPIGRDAAVAARPIPVPEPETWALVVLGVGMVLLVARYRRAAH